mgnify:CR=1 FL=1
MANSFFVGCGYVGRKVAQQERQDGGCVGALVRRIESAKSLQREGIEAISIDLDQPSSLPTLDLTGRTLYWFAPPPLHGTKDPRIESLLSSIELTALPSRIILISTTGVYGDCDGAWINESQPLCPKTARARRRVSAEKVIEHWGHQTGVTTVILRVPGIYGPDRLPIARLKRREPVLTPDQSPWSNRIHVEDLVRVCITAARMSDPALVYNVSDGHPSTMAEFFFEVAKSRGLPLPPMLDRQSAEKESSSKMLSYLNESKRIDNSLMRDHLGVVPNFPDLNIGLQSEINHL